MLPSFRKPENTLNGVTELDELKTVESQDIGDLYIEPDAYGKYPSFVIFEGEENSKNTTDTTDISNNSSISDSGCWPFCR